jgi:hypothetical protein
MTRGPPILSPFGCSELVGRVPIGGGRIYLSMCLLSLVVEHSLCKRKVGGSIPPVGFCFFCVGFLRARLTKKKRKGDDIAEI